MAKLAEGRAGPDLEVTDLKTIKPCWSHIPCLYNSNAGKWVINPYPA